MTRFKKILRSPITSTVMFALAAVLLLTGAIGGARAAINDQTRTYVTGTSLYSIGVSLYENDDKEPLAYRNYVVSQDGSADGTWDVGSKPMFKTMIGTGDTFSAGTMYDEKLYVVNSGDIDEYVRVTFYRYWMKDGKKLQGFDPDLIKLVLNENSWILDPEATTDERLVLYYPKILPVGKPTDPVLEGILIKVDSNELKPKVTTQTWKDDDGVTHARKIYAYEYDGATFCLEAEVDAVQTHHAAAAILSAWGKVVTVNESSGVLSFAK